MLAALQFEFIRNAILAGVLASLICGIIGTFVVVNRIVFLAGGIAHATYGGIGIAFFFGLNYLACTLGFTIFAALIMAASILNAKNRADTFIGVLWAVGMAMGVLLLDLTPGYHVDLMSYLFGSILTVSQNDLWLMLSIGTLIVWVVSYFYKDFLAMSYDAEFAQLRGVPIKFLYFQLIAMIALSVVMLIRVVGLILVIALLTISPYIAEKYTGSLQKMMLFSVLLNLLFTIAGLWLSYTYNLTCGATIIMVSAGGFFISLLWDQIKHFRIRLKLKQSQDSTFNPPVQKQKADL